MRDIPIAINEKVFEFFEFLMAVSTPVILAHM